VNDSPNTAETRAADGSTTPVAAPTYPDKKNYTLKEAALYLNISTRTVERLIQRGLLRRNKALRKIFIPRMELDRFLERTL